MEGEKLPSNPLETILRDLEEDMDTLGLEICILDEEESAEVRSMDDKPENRQLIAVESTKTLTKNIITRAKLLVAEQNSSLYQLSFEGEVGDKIGHITITSKVN